MKKNVGGFDKILRIAAGVALIGYALYSGEWWGYLGVVPLVTAFIGWCPAYLPFGLSTCKTKESK
ncbi:MAG: DUF2892 domain-containing protein [Ignavibacteriaceae bacterium]|nr:DUF2892 domain-containing protein [Ignavibacteriaceae bacterium]HRI47121.1 DUF2892 domain-containing protein [Ignavibacteriaceae bacterium]